MAWSWRRPRFVPSEAAEVQPLAQFAIGFQKLLQLDHGG